VKRHQKEKKSLKLAVKVENVKLEKYENEVLLLPLVIGHAVLSSVPWRTKITLSREPIIL